jgi:3-oxoacyl-[acyl-carrier protein] reductase
MRRALVFGGTGTVGREVLRGLAEAGVSTVFTYHHSRERAAELASSLGFEGRPVDLADPAQARGLIRSLDPPPDVFVHCAAVNPARPFVDLTDEDWQRLQAVNVQSALVACQELAPRMKAGGDIVLVGALDRTQSLPLPPHFAATQGALGALTMALAKELGPAGIRVNLVALGLLEDGLSRDLSPELLADFERFSSLRRRGRAAEAAKVLLWLALHNSYMSGKVLSVNGGI